MLRKAMLSFSACAMLGAVAAVPARALPITVPFSGTITSVTDPGGYLDPSIAVGSPFSGNYSIEPAFGSTAPILGGVSYFLTSAGSTQATIEGIPFTSLINGVLVADGFTGPGGGDAWSASTFVAIGDIFVQPHFQDTTGTKLASDGFFVNQELAGWDLAQFAVLRYTGGPVAEILAVGDIDTIPEPASGALLGSGLLLVGARRRHLRRRHQRVA